MRNRVRPIVAVVVVAALCAVAILVGQNSALNWSEFRAAAALALLGIAADTLIYGLPQGAKASVAFIPFTAVAIVAPSWNGVATVALAVACVQVILRRPLIKATFNVAQSALSVACGALVYKALGGPTIVGASAVASSHAASQLAWPLLALLTVFVLVNTISVSFVVAASEGSRPLDVWKANTLSTGAYFLFSAPLVVGLVWMLAKFGPIGAALVSLPMLGVRQLFVITIRLQQHNRELLQLMVKAMEARDTHTSGHSLRVAERAVVIARGIGLPARQVERIRVAALLHDIGKIHEAYAPILRKQGKLTDDEWLLMKTHPVTGAELIATLSDMSDLVAPIRHHHEKWDGTGYPDRIAGEAIPLAARIITFADTLDAMLSDRPYREALTAEIVRAEFARNCGTQFDPTICGQVLAPHIWDQLFPAPTDAEHDARGARQPSGRPTWRNPIRFRTPRAGTTTV